MLTPFFNFSKTNSIANKFVAELRDVDVQNDRMRFRLNLERLGELFAYEISKTFDYIGQQVETPFGESNVQVPVKAPVLATILRAGLPMHQGLLKIFDQAGSAFVSAYRRHHKDGSFEINLEYASCPNLDDQILIISDPMLATGSSMDLTIKELMKHGNAACIHVVTAIAAADGVEYLLRRHPNIKLWVAAIDEELTAKSYIVPGLGDAGDLAFGPKVQE